MTHIERVVWRITGTDPLAFLQATTTQDHTGQAVGESRWCATLDPHGRVLAFLRSTPVDASTVLLDGEAACEAGIAWLAQIAPLSRCTIERTDLVAEPVEAEQDEWTRVSRGWVRFGLDVTDADLLNDTPLLALCTSFSKGCYRGQETVAKIQNLGHARRAFALATLATPDAPVSGTEVIVGDRSIGRVTSSVTDGRHARAIVSVRAEHSASDATIRGEAATLEPIMLAEMPSTTAPPPTRPVSRAFGRR